MDVRHNAYISTAARDCAARAAGTPLLRVVCGGRWMFRGLCVSCGLGVESNGGSLGVGIFFGWSIGVGIAQSSDFATPSHREVRWIELQ